RLAPPPAPARAQSPLDPEPLAPPPSPAILEAVNFEPVSTTPEPPPPPATPLRFQLAAGMALEVDGSLDLRGHSVSDAMERLKDRLGDGLVLGWRSLQVTLGPDPALHEGLLELLSSGEAPMVARYAQAPVPMGGTQAWLLYLGPPQAQT
ncbi:MAG: Smr/MutS family protein, partial [Geothrix sp.]|nr:Smr/MutS family protein [Geothrix sp.]